MASPLKISSMGVLGLGGAALGMYLGNAAISEINPIYFQDPPTRFHADLSPYRSSSGDVYAARMDTATPLELGSGCIGCRTYPEEYYPDRDPSLDLAIEGAAAEAAPVQAAVAEAAFDAELPRRQADLERLRRYASYALSEQDQADAAPVEAEATGIEGDELASAD